MDGRGEGDEAMYVQYMTVSMGCACRLIRRMIICRIICSRV